MQTPGQQRYHSRVRSGCLTCRSRKVKCDEAKPTCSNCARLKRNCMYKPTTTRPPSVRVQTEQPIEAPASSGAILALGTRNNHEPSSEAFSPWESHQTRHSINSINNSDSTSSTSTSTSTSTSSANVEPDSGIHAGPPRGDSSMALISRDIELTTTIDILALRTESPHMTALFLDQVECPSLTPFDPCGWRLAKRHLVHLGRSCPAVGAGITAVAALHRGLLYGLPLSGAQTHYHAARRQLDELLDDYGRPFGVALAAVFLLCMFECVHAGSMAPHLREPGPLLVRRLESWAQDVASHSGLSARIVAWLRVLQASMTRGGAAGLLSKRVARLLPSHTGLLPDIEPLPGQEINQTDPADPSDSSDHSDHSDHLCQLLGAPIFDFYCRLQALSRQVARLTLYHRSRTTSADQQQVADRMASLKTQLRALWDGRSATQRQTPDQLRAQLAPTIAARIASLIAICDAAYHAELVEIGRQLGDPLSRLPDSREALHRIREAVVREPDGSGGEKTNAGFLRALFLYAIESTEQEQTKWAVEKLAQIKPPVYRGAFFSAFAKALSEEQIRKDRRVTSRYFCIWYFGVSPPYM